MRPPRTSSATRQLGGPQVVGSPQLLDGGQQPAARVGGGRVGALVELAQDAEHARELVDRGAPARLGGVRGHHQPQLGAVEHLGELLLGRAGVAQCRDHVAQRAGARPLGIGGVAGAQAPDALVVLGQVDELKPPGQRAHQHLGLIEGRDRPRARPAGRRPPRPRDAPPGPARRRRRAGADRPAGPAAHRDHLAQDVGEQRLVGGEVAACGGDGSSAGRCSQKGAAPPRAPLEGRPPRRSRSEGRPPRAAPRHSNVSSSAGNPTANSISKYALLVRYGPASGRPRRTAGPGAEHVAQPPRGAAAQGQPAARAPARPAGGERGLEALVGAPGRRVSNTGPCRCERAAGTRLC